MAARVDEDSFRRAHEALGRREARRRVREEVETVEGALARALQDAVVVYETLRQLTAAAAFLSFQRHQVARPLPEDPTARLLETLRRGRERQAVRRISRQFDARDHFHAETDRARPALEACFGSQALAHLDQISGVYHRAWQKLENRETRILRRLGSTIRGVSPEHGDVIAHAPVSDAATYGDDVVFVFDPFFGIGATSRNQLLGGTGRERDLQLLQAAVLLHEGLHWVVEIGAGHQRHGDRYNPQNYEFYLSQRHARRPLSYSALNTLRRQ